MKYLILLIISTTALNCCLQAQIDAKAAEEYIRYDGGGAMGKKTIVPKLDKLAIAQARVYFKQATTRDMMENERGAFGQRKSLGGSVAGRLTAYLEITDGELTPQDYSQLADGFYDYLSGKLKASGIRPVDWNAIAGAEFYTADKAEVDEKELEEMQKRGQIYHAVNAKNGNMLHTYNPFGTAALNMGFAFGKAKRAANFSKDVGAPLVFMHVIVDFADILLDAEVRTGEGTKYGADGVARITKSKNFKFDASAGANLKVAASNCFSHFYNEKYQVDNFWLVKDVSSGLPFAKKVSQDASKEVLKGNKFSIMTKTFNATPVVVETTKEQYMAAAKKALENYADVFVGKIMAHKKS